MKACLCCFFLIVLIHVSQAQDDLKFGDTGTTNKKSPTYKSKNKDFRKGHLIQWIKNDTKGLLLGNRCMEDVTRSMRFEYVVQPKGQPGNRSEFGRLIHNFFAKIGITFRNGPFWKFKLKKKRKECRRKTGDYVG